MKLFSLLAVFALAIPANAQTYHIKASDGTSVIVTVEPKPKVVTMVVPQAQPMPAMAVPVQTVAYAPSYAAYAARPAVMFARPEPVTVHRKAFVATWVANRPRLVTVCP